LVHNAERQVHPNDADTGPTTIIRRPSREAFYPQALLATFVASVVMGDSCGSIRLARLSENWAELCGHKVVWIFAPDLNPISRHIPVLLCHDLTFGLFG
jgi:hypothetical protein